MAHKLVKPPPIHLGRQFYVFLTEERMKEKGALFTKSHVVLIVHKKEVRTGGKPSEKTFTIRIKDTILHWKEAKSSKDAPEPAFNWCLEYLCDCAHL